MVLRDRVKKGLAVGRYSKTYKRVHVPKSLYHSRAASDEIVEPNFASACILAGWSDEVNAVRDDLKCTSDDSNSQWMLLPASESRLADLDISIGAILQIVSRSTIYRLLRV